MKGRLKGRSFFAREIRERTPKKERKEKKELARE